MVKIELTEEGVRLVTAKGSAEMVWDEYRQLRNIILTDDYESTEKNI